MILIVGNSNDDILYFESILKNKREVSILNQFPGYTGEIFGQNIILVKDVYSSYVSSAVVSYVIEKYMAILVIFVGSVQSFTDTLDVGDICICKQAICGDVNLSDVQNIAKGQIYGFPQIFNSSNEISTSLQNAIENRTDSHAKQCTFINQNFHPEDKEQLDAICDKNRIFGITGETVLSSEIGGVAVAAKMHDVPFTAVTVVGRKIGFGSDIEDYIHVLDQYSNVGKAVTSVIGEIGRTDVISH